MLRSQGTSTCLTSDNLGLQLFKQGSRHSFQAPHVRTPQRPPRPSITFAHLTARIRTTSAVPRTRQRIEQRSFPTAFSPGYRAPCITPAIDCMRTSASRCCYEPASPPLRSPPKNALAMAGRPDGRAADVRQALAALASRTARCVVIDGPVTSSPRPWAVRTPTETRSRYSFWRAWLSRR